MLIQAEDYTLMTEAPVSERDLAKENFSIGYEDLEVMPTVISPLVLP